MIEFDVIPTPVGPCLVEVENGRLVRLQLGGGSIEAGRRRRLRDARRWVADWFKGRPVQVPLKLEGTAFMRRIYEVVRRIPPGQTRSYGEVADEAGRPGAARAVGAAMAKNRICLFIPCHRVVGASGLGGWSGSGGLEQKKALLDLERKR
ncbi:MAG: methylated-DNA--[protein]-cysteine S-methyltransferase [Planctomycetes bacterium]|nr:methylated-DNA--[protein]-cysteine S-methyltransferase [Planctomycetota bacterium]